MFHISVAFSGICMLVNATPNAQFLLTDAAFVKHATNVDANGQAPIIPAHTAFLRAYDVDVDPNLRQPTFTTKYDNQTVAFFILRPDEKLKIEVIPTADPHFNSLVFDKNLQYYAENYQPHINDERFALDRVPRMGTKDGLCPSCQLDPNKRPIIVTATLGNISAAHLSEDSYYFSPHDNSKSDRLPELIIVDMMTSTNEITFRSNNGKDIHLKGKDSGPVRIEIANFPVSELLWDGDKTPGDDYHFERNYAVFSEATLPATLPIPRLKTRSQVSHLSKQSEPKTRTKSSTSRSGFPRNPDGSNCPPVQQ